MTDGSEAFLEAMFQAKSHDTRLGVDAMQRMAKHRDAASPNQRTEHFERAFIEIGARVFGSIEVLKDAVQHGSSFIVQLRWPVVEELTKDAAVAVGDFADSPSHANDLIATMRREGAERVAGYEPTVDAQVQTVVARYLNAQSQEASGEKHGCFVATAVYGSYDCPEVWMLRRFRDQTLQRSGVGRAFIRLYYGVSPFVVRHGGRWVPRLARRPVGMIVDTLARKGVAGTPYRDADPSGTVASPRGRNSSLRI